MFNEIGFIEAAKIRELTWVERPMMEKAGPSTVPKVPWASVPICSLAAAIALAS
jgi:hypothetical protein